MRSGLVFITTIKDAMKAETDQLALFCKPVSVFSIATNGARAAVRKADINRCISRVSHFVFSQ
jgi:hypothetical protein